MRHFSARRIALLLTIRARTRQTGWVRVATVWVRVATIWVRVGIGCVWFLIVWVWVATVWVQVATVWVQVATVWVQVATVWVQVATVWVQVATVWVQVATIWVRVATIWVRVGIGCVWFLIVWVRVAIIWVRVVIVWVGIILTTASIRRLGGIRRIIRVGVISSTGHIPEHRSNEVSYKRSKDIDYAIPVVVLRPEDVKVLVLVTSAHVCPELKLCIPDRISLGKLLHRSERSVVFILFWAEV